MVERTIPRHMGHFLTVALRIEEAQVLQVEKWPQGTKVIAFFLSQQTMHPKVVTSASPTLESLDGSRGEDASFASSPALA